jgi:hypothetical protein
VLREQRAPARTFFDHAEGKAGRIFREKRRHERPVDGQLGQLRAGVRHGAGFSVSLNVWPANHGTARATASFLY